MHGVYVEDVRLHSPLQAELQFVDYVISARFSLGRKIQSRRRQLQLHQSPSPAQLSSKGGWTWQVTEEPRQPPRIIRFSACPMIHCPLTRLQASKLKEGRVESLGNLNKSLTVRNTPGLPFNAQYACTGMHRFTISPNLTHSNKS